MVFDGLAKHLLKVAGAHNKLPMSKQFRDAAPCVDGVCAFVVRSFVESQLDEEGNNIKVREQPQKKPRLGGGDRATANHWVYRRQTHD